MRALKLVGILAVIMAAYLIVNAAHAQGGQPIPALPSADVINKVIADSQGPIYTPLGLPGPVNDALGTLKAPAFATLSQQIDSDHVIYSFSPDTGLTRVLMPLKDAATTTLAPDMKTPDDNQPGKVIGATFEPDKGTIIIVAVWKDTGKSAKPVDIRLYADGKQLPDSTAYKINLRKFKGDNKGKPGAGDIGVILAARETCYTFSLDQVCYGPKKYARNDQISKMAEQALADLSKTYDMKAKFDTDGAVSEILGKTARAACSESLSKATEFTTKALPDCAVNLVFTSVSKVETGGPIALFSVLTDIQMNVYDTTGTNVQTLPAGSYLVLDATPQDAASKLGSPGALFLVSANGKDQYLIPSQVVEGFGGSSDPEADSRRGQAGVKDGFIPGRGF